MKMMLFCFVLLSVALIYKGDDGSSGPLEENLFYDDTYYLKKIQLKKFKDEMAEINNKSKKNKSDRPSIRNLNEYVSKNFAENATGADFELMDKGNCTQVNDLGGIFQTINNEDRNYTENLMNIQDYLNERNHIFTDEFGNLLIYSVCGDLFMSKCHSKFLFVSKVDYQFFEFAQSGEKIPMMTGYSTDFMLDRSNNRRIMYLFGGIDNRGVHNQELFKIDFDYTFGLVKIIKSGVNNKESAPKGVSESSLNLLIHSVENKDKAVLIFSYGGINEESVSEQLHVYNPLEHTWTEIKTDKSPLPKRKGHSTLLVDSEETQIAINTFTNPLNKELIRSYFLLIFGGKSLSDYHNNLMIVQVNFMMLDDTFFYKSFTNVQTVGDVPSPREGHRSFLRDDYMYILGGCNYEKKKCFHDELYRLNLNTNPFRWEKLDLNLNKGSTTSHTDKSASWFDEKNLNLQNYMGQLVNIGFCNNDGCDNTFKIVLADIDCLCKDKQITSLDKPDQEERANSNLKLTCTEIKSRIITKRKTLDDKNNTNIKITKALNITLTNNSLHNLTNNTIPHNQTNNSSFVEDRVLMNDNNNLTDIFNISSIIENFFKEDPKINTKNNKTIINKIINSQINKTTPNKIIKQTSSEKIYKNARDSLLLNFTNTTVENDKKAESKSHNPVKKIKKKKKKKKGHINNHTRSRIESFNTTEITKIINEAVQENIKPLIKENEKLRKALVFSSSEYEENPHPDLNLNDTFVSFFQTKEKFIKRKFIENVNYTKAISENITGIKEFIKKSNNQTNEDMKYFLEKMLNDIEKSTEMTSKQLEEFKKFQKDQQIINEKVNQINKVKCVNGYMFNLTSCQCIPGYAGKSCEIKLSCEGDCNNNGVCKFGKCFCNPGFLGKNCKVTDKCPNDCNAKGKCLYGKCFCDLGFFGEDCKLQHKCRKDCSNKGICFRGKCLCEPGHSGKDCSVLAVQFQPCKDNCNGSGICKLEKCFCYPGFKGKFCEIKNEFSCPPFKVNDDITSNQVGKNSTNSTNSNSTWTPCNGNGVCKYGLCFCFPGFKSEDCSIKEHSSLKKKKKTNYFKNMKFKEINTEDSALIVDSKIPNGSYDSYESNNPDLTNTTNTADSILSESENEQRFFYTAIVISVIAIVVFFVLILSKKTLMQNH